MKQLKFAEQARNKTSEFYSKRTHLFRPWHKHLQMFCKELYKTVGAFAHKQYYIYIDIDKILIAL